MQKDTEHIALWRELAAQTQREHDREAARLQAQLGELRQELEDRPEKHIVTYIDADELATARDEKTRAFTARLRAFQTLAEILALHRERTSGHCQCGAPFADCKVAQILYGNDTFTRWIDDQVSRLQLYRDCDLPGNFPARFDPRWRR